MVLTKNRGTIGLRFSVRHPLSRLAGSCPASGVVMLGDIFRIGRDRETISAQVIAAVDEHKLGRIGARGEEQPGRELRVLGRQGAAAAFVIRPKSDVERNSECALCRSLDRTIPGSRLRTC